MANKGGQCELCKVGTVVPTATKQGIVLICNYCGKHHEQENAKIEVQPRKAGRGNTADKVERVPAAGRKSAPQRRGNR